MSFKLISSCFLGFLVFFINPISSVHAEEATEEVKELLNTSLTDILKQQNIRVTSVSKKAEKLSDAAASIYVVTAEDIRRSGLTSIPEILRLVPGIQVSQITSNKWAISARGFTDQIAAKMLVIIDGRSIYTPLFSGVNWDEHDLMIEDIDRIEVIRGPGGTLWGANAVNGVINIVTKKAKDTPATLMTATYGNYENGTAGVRKGGQIGENVFYRVYGKYFDRGESQTNSNQGAGDSWQMKQSGFRIDAENIENNSFTLQGDLFRSNQDRDVILPTLTTPFTERLDSEETRVGGNILGRWEKKIAENSSTSLQAYFSNIHRDNPLTLDQRINTFDLDFQHNWQLDERNELIWGADYRFITSDTNGTVYLNFDPANRSTNLFSIFIQDKYSVIPDKLFLTLGTKLEHNDFTGFEYQPNARLTWKLSDTKTLWAAVSRAVRTPSLAEDDITIVVGNLKPGFAQWLGQTNFDSEDLIAYEIGYRVQPQNNFFMDFSTFVNDYSHLRSYETGTPFIDSSTSLPPHLVVPIPFGNNAFGQVYGFETAAYWDVTPKWQLSGGYSFDIVDIHTKAGGTDTLSQIDEGKTAQNNFNLRSHLSLPHNLELDNSLYFVDNLSTIHIPSYLRFDTSFSWSPIAGLELRLVGQNLFDNSHPEFSAPLQGDATQVGRNAYGKVTWRF
ncbi:MAG: TonB-dependent receptor [Alphaproteobacteria bacterium]|nr:TonB-dependent receptor [Alphaproteobacteria bacterium]